MYSACRNEFGALNPIVNQVCTLLDEFAIESEREFRVGWRGEG